MTFSSSKELTNLPLEESITGLLWGGLLGLPLPFSGNLKISTCLPSIFLIRCYSFVNSPQTIKRPLTQITFLPLLHLWIIYSRKPTYPIKDLLHLLFLKNFGFPFRIFLEFSTKTRIPSIILIICFPSMIFVKNAFSGAIRRMITDKTHTPPILRKF